MVIKKVLLVDDDKDLLRIAQLSLSKVGKWSVHIATCGAEALKIAPEVRPDVIILDVMMPGMDGVATLARLRETAETAEIPVIFLTAKVQLHEVDAYIQQGACGVIIKPFDPMTLPDEIKRILNA
jgi:two-component system OmpR family response regulator